MTDETGAPAGGELLPSSTPAQDTGGDLSASGRAAQASSERKARRSSRRAAARLIRSSNPNWRKPARPGNGPREVTEEAEPAENLAAHRAAEVLDEGRKGTLPILASRNAGIPAHSRTGTGTGFPPSQNEIAEQRKAVEAEREAAEKLRQQYEAKLPKSCRPSRRRPVLGYPLDGGR
jgi:hypothetical protein